jgi:hypothetical protein
MKDKYNRRDFIEAGGLATAGFYVMPLFASCKTGTTTVHPSLGNIINKDFDADVDRKLTASPLQTKIFSQNSTDTYSYSASIIKGSKDNLQEIQENRNAVYKEVITNPNQFNEFLDLAQEDESARIFWPGKHKI